MPNYLEYQKSVVAEFKALEKRVRHLIDNNHWGEEGHFKEAILINYLRRVLPKHLSVGTGFIRNKDNITKQIDIIIYDNTYPLLFSEGDFIIATSENVVAIIEVKSNIVPNKICEIIDKANRNAEIITDNSDMFLFNGIFSYNSNPKPEVYIDNLKKHDFSYLTEKNYNQVYSRRLLSCVNHISLGSSYFLKLWPLGQDEENNRECLSENPDNYKPYYSLYKMDEDLAISYFLSNLQEFIIKKASGTYRAEIPKEMKEFLYPLQGGKELNLVDRAYLEQRGAISFKGQKFLELEKLFKSCKEDYIVLSFDQIEIIIGQKLCDSAYKYPAYWHPSETHTITLSWINEGFELDKVDLVEKQVAFKRVVKE